MPAYVVSRVQIRDADAMRRYVDETPATVAAFGGKYHFRGSNVQALEGAWEHERLVILEFPTKQDALAWYESDLYRPLRDLRHASADTIILLADGDAGFLHDLNTQRFYHGTKADLKPGDLIEAGYDSNYGQRKKAGYVYLTATLNAATWGAELAAGEGRGRIYTVEPTGPIEDDPNLTDKKYPGNPMKSYRTRDPLRVTGEITDWKGHSPEELKAMHDHLERLRELGIEAIED